MCRHYDDMPPEPPPYIETQECDFCKHQVDIRDTRLVIDEHICTDCLKDITPRKVWDWTEQCPEAFHQVYQKILTLRNGQGISKVLG